MATVTYNKIKKAMKGAEASTKIEWNGVEIKVNKRISLEDFADSVAYVSTSAFNVENGEYIPEAVDFILRLVTISRYTNIEIPEDINDKYELCYADGLMDAVTAGVDADQYHELIDAVHRKISYIREMKANEFISEAKKMVESINTFVNLTRGVFEGVESEDLQSLIAAISDGKIDESKIMQAYIDSKAEDAQ